MASGKRNQKSGIQKPLDADLIAKDKAKSSPPQEPVGQTVINMVIGIASVVVMAFIVIWMIQLIG